MVTFDSVAYKRENIVCFAGIITRGPKDDVLELRATWQLYLVSINLVSGVR